MSAPKLILGPHFGDASPTVTKLSLGAKAEGLFELPPSWTPPFMVISLGATKPDDIGVDAIRKMLLTSGMWSLPSKLLPKKTDQLIVRSSASIEDIEARGWLTSQQSASAIDDVLRVLSTVWLNSREALDELDNTAILSLLIQRYHPPKLQGHLSNERRVSKNHNHWLREVESVEKSRKTRLIRIKQPTKAIRKSALFCVTEVELDQRLSEVAEWSVKGGKRVHYEWSWDGSRLWIVQRDIEPKRDGGAPSSSSCDVSFSALIPKTKVFIDGVNATKPWKKIESLRVFNDAGLDAANLFVLEDSRVINQLMAGRITAALRSDLSQLCASPIVFRTDKLLDGEDVNFLSPRSETIYSVESAEEWLTDTAKKMKAQGVKATKICFICHRYIVARSGAFALARPGTPRVLIDSIWGLPDGLLCFSHDSFEVDCLSKSVRKVIRCKRHFLASDESGKWRQKHCPEPWDWEDSLQDDELHTIAAQTLKIADSLSAPVEVMYFVGVNLVTGYPAVLPWIHVLDLPARKGEAADNYYGGNGFTVTNEADLNRLSAVVKARITGEKPFLRLCPVPDLLRSKEFVNRVAAAALELRVPVELQGSMLSHIYYMLERKGIRIRCAQKLLTEKSNRRKFVKLVRDDIPGNIEAKGERVRSVQVPHDVLYELLRAKAIEEAFEFFRAEEGSKAFEELADMLEVIRGACAASGRSFSDLVEVADRKRSERGGFEKGVLLVETENVRLIAPDEDPSLIPGASSHKRRKLNAVPSLRQRVKARVPFIHAGKIIIPMIPPDSRAAQHFAVDAGDKEHQLFIEYREKDLMVELRRAPKLDDSPNQLELQFDKAPSRRKKP